MNDAIEKSSEELCSAVNKFQSEKELAEYFARTAHKTLQQSFMRLCIHFIETAAKDNYNFDGRNEATHEAAKKIVEKTNNFEAIALPMV